MTQVVIERTGEAFFPGYSTEWVFLRALTGKLPEGMKAGYRVRRYDDGRIEVNGHKQARSKHGKRWVVAMGADAVSRADAEILSWAKRILRERAKETKS